MIYFKEKRPEMLIPGRLNIHKSIFGMLFETQMGSF
jgi:hypothetical protein